MQATYQSSQQLWADIDQSACPAWRLMEIAKDPEAPLWALWVVFQYCLRSDRIPGLMFWHRCYDIRHHPCLDLYLLEDPKSATCLVKECDEFLGYYVGNQNR